MFLVTAVQNKSFQDFVQPIAGNRNCQAMAQAFDARIAYFHITDEPVRYRCFSSKASTRLLFDGGLNVRESNVGLKTIELSLLHYKSKKTETRVRAIPGHTCPVFAVRSSFNCPQRGWNSAQSAAAPSLRCCATCRCATSSCCFSSRLATFWSYVGNSTSTFCTNNRPQISLLGLLATAVGTHTIESNQKP